MKRSTKVGALIVALVTAAAGGALLASENGQAPTQIVQAADPAQIQQECQQALGYSGRNQDDITWLNQCVHALASPTPTAVPTTATPTPTVTTAFPTASPTTSPTSSPTPTPTPTGTGTPGSFPDATTTGPGVDCSTLKRASGFTASTDGATYSGWDIHGAVQIRANNVTIKNSCITATNSQDIGVAIYWVFGTTVSHVKFLGSRYQGIQAYDASGGTFDHNDISSADDGISTCTGVVKDNYIHNPRTGGHTDLVECTGYKEAWGDTSLLVQNNTLLNNLSQTSAVGLAAGNDGSEVPMHRATVDHNLMAGGSYSLYGGSTDARNGSLPGYHIVITNNVFDTRYFPQCGSAGFVTAYIPAAGSVWSGNMTQTGAPVNP